MKAQARESPSKSTKPELGEIVGQEGAIQHLLRALETSRLAHAYLFQGPPSVGKMSTAFAFARHCLRHASTTKNGSKKSVDLRILQGQHPDVRIFKPRDEGSGNLPVQIIREEVLPYTRFAPFEADKAFVIFQDVDIALPPNQQEAANALLKALEEPRPGVHFILTTANQERVLPTIRSRCQAVPFQRLRSEHLWHIATQMKIETEDARDAILIAEGSVERMVEMCEKGRDESILQTLEKGLQALYPSRGGNGFFQWMSWCEKVGTEATTMLQLLGRAHRDIAVLSAQREQLEQGSTKEAPENSLTLHLEPLRAQLDSTALLTGTTQATEAGLAILALEEKVGRKAISTQLAFESLWNTVHGEVV